MTYPFHGGSPEERAAAMAVEVAWEHVATHRMDGYGHKPVVVATVDALAAAGLLIPAPSVRDATPERDALERVRALHSRRDVAASPAWLHDGDELSPSSKARVECADCGKPWPCPTNAALDGFR